MLLNNTFLASINDDFLTVATLINILIAGYGIWIYASIITGRIRDIGISDWWIMLGILPYVSFGFILYLLSAKGKHSKIDKDESNNELASSSKKNTGLIKKIGFVFLFLVLIIVAALGSGIGTAAVDEYFPAPNSNPDAEIISSTGFRIAHQKAYIEGCIKSGSNQAYCDCSFGKFKEAFTPEELAGLVKEYKATGQMDERMSNLMSACQHLKQ